MNTKFYLLAVIALVTALSSIVLAEDKVVRYPRPETLLDQRVEYPLQLLRLAFSKVSGEYELIPTSQVMPQGRALVQLNHGVDVDVVWSMTSTEREFKLLPVRIPIYKGLIGWRLFLVNKQELGHFQDEMSISKLRSFQLVQGHDWPDTQILRANGFNVLGIPSYNSMFAMISRSRVDLFPRSIVEIWAEAENHKANGIVVEPTKVLIYPAALYYFVTPGNTRLSVALEKGLRAALEDGSFDALFQQYHSNLINRARLDERHKYYLDNPTLPIGTPIKEEQLWFSVKQ